jgi:hypothetical protein
VWSPFLFNLACDELIKQTEENNNGFVVTPAKPLVSRPIGLFADDASLQAVTDDRLEALVGVVHDWCRSAGVNASPSARIEIYQAQMHFRSSVSRSARGASAWTVTSMSAAEGWTGRPIITAESRGLAVCSATSAASRVHGIRADVWLWYVLSSVPGLSTWLVCSFL